MHHEKPNNRQHNNPRIPSESVKECNLVCWNLGQNFFEIRRYFSKIFGNSADTVVEILLKIEVNRLFFNEKPLFLPISHKKVQAKFFDTDAEKGVPNMKTRFPQKKTKSVAMFFV